MNSSSINSRNGPKDGIVSISTNGFIGTNSRAFQSETKERKFGAQCEK